MSGSPSRGAGTRRRHERWLDAQQFDNPANIEVPLTTRATNASERERFSGRHDDDHRCRHRGSHHGMRAGCSRRRAAAQKCSQSNLGLAGDLGRQSGAHPLQGIGAGFLPKIGHTLVCSME